MTQLKITIEWDESGYIAVAEGGDAMAIGQGETFEEAVAEATSAYQLHFEGFAMDAETTF
jgi:predicted RNase H-like HicB family nuclease